MIIITCQCVSLRRGASFYQLVALPFLSFVLWMERGGVIIVAMELNMRPRSTSGVSSLAFLKSRLPSGTKGFRT